jgi:hypothetical protein
MVSKPRLTTAPLWNLNDFALVLDASPIVS